MMFEKCSKFHWCILRGFDFIETVYERFDNTLYIFKIYISRNRPLTEEVLNIKRFALYLVNNQNSKPVFEYLWSVLQINDLSKQYVKYSDSNLKPKYIVSLWSWCQNLIERLERTQYHLIPFHHCSEPDETSFIVSWTSDCP